MKIAILGAGALGSAFAAGFIAAGHEVSLIDVSAALVDAVNAGGITVVGAEGESTVAAQASCDPDAAADADLVMVFVKAYDTEAAAGLIAPVLAPAAVLVTLQNGLGAAEVLERHCPGARIVYGVTYHAATLLAPGRVRHAVGPTYAGPHVGQDTSGAQILATACTGAGWPAQALADVAPAVWKKLALNCTNAVAALTGMNGGAEVGDERVHRLLVDVMGEALALAHALGHTGLDLEACVRDMDDVLTRAGEGRASMLQDFDAGRRTEVDALNGAVVRSAERLGIDVPINRALYSLVKGWERTHGFA